jgi:hypothetical protein
MRKLFVSIFAGAIMSAFAFAQTDSMSAPNSAQQPKTAQAAHSATNTSPAQTNTIKIAPGSVIPVQLTKTVDAKKLKSGDEVQAKVTQDMKNGNGEVLVPKDTKVLGHVTEAQVRNKEQKESELGIAFDHAILKDGSQLSLPMSIQAIIGQQNPNGPNNNAAADAGPSASAPSSPSVPNAGSSGNSGRPSTMGSGTSQQQMPTASAGDNGAPSGSSAAPITGNTKGVVGISNLTLSTAEGAQGSVITSDKNNVKLDSGTFMLLRVNQNAGKPQ